MTWSTLLRLWQNVSWLYYYHVTSCWHIMEYCSRKRSSDRLTVSLLWYLCCDLAGAIWLSLRWRHNEGDIVSNHQPRDCLLNRLFRTGEFPALMASNAKNVSIRWRHHGFHAVNHPDTFPMQLFHRKYVWSLPPVHMKAGPALNLIEAIFSINNAS